jgi:hypothetical protein
MQSNHRSVIREHLRLHFLVKYIVDGSLLVFNKLLVISRSVLILLDYRCAGWHDLFSISIIVPTLKNHFMISFPKWNLTNTYCFIVRNSSHKECYIFFIWNDRREKSLHSITNGNIYFDLNLYLRTLIYNFAHRWFICQKKRISQLA